MRQWQYGQLEREMSSLSIKILHLDYSVVAKIAKIRAPLTQTHSHMPYDFITIILRGVITYSHLHINKEETET